MTLLQEINSSSKKPFYLLLIFLSILLAYVFWLFIYLKIFGVYSVASITKANSSSEGIVYEYEFQYNGLSYNGTFTGNSFKIGSRYFVLFSKSNPDKNLFQYDLPVPNCLQDSINMFWNDLPNCKNSSSR